MVIHYPKERLWTRGEIMIHPNIGTIPGGRPAATVRAINEFLV